jgi:antitoxin (DNA-binding transcriptional repressor) of toxin-antitoxin stability system
MVSAYPEITQRDLRTSSREIMDAVEHGQSFTVTRDGHRIGELIPLRRRRRVVDLMIAATAIAEGLALYTTNPGDFIGLDDLVRIVPVTRPPVPRERPARGRA